jgi:hypothetical protein
MALNSLLLAWLLAASPAGALELTHEKPDEFFARSKEDPGRLYALLIGATWCPPCHVLTNALTELPATTSTAIGRAVWSKVESDVYGEKSLQDFLAGVSAFYPPTGIPSVVVVRGGRALGLSTCGAETDQLERFLLDSEARGAAAPSARLPALACPGRPDDASYTLGISGYLSETQRDTDDYGRRILLAFSAASPRPPSELFAPGGRQSVSGSVEAPSGAGLFFTGDPILPFASLLGEVERSTAALSRLASAPGRRLRLILTGHATEEGELAVGYAPNEFVHSHNSPLDLPAKDVASAVLSARAAGKEVRGLVTTCYAGRFAEGFMPSPGAAAACAAFATLPDKTSEGCYRDGMAAGADYVSSVSDRMDCSAKKDGRRLHYDVMAAASSRDIPMLSSEYFLLYGEAGAFLGSGARVPAPPHGLGRFKLASGVLVYADLVSGTVVAAVKDGRRVELPRLAVMDCRSPWRKQLSFFYLRRRIGREETNCAPIVRLYWDADGEDVFPAEEVSFINGHDTLSVRSADQFWDYRPRGSNSSYDDDFYGKLRKEFESDLPREGATVDASGLRTEARVLLKTVIPPFTAPFGNEPSAQTLADLLNRLGDELRPDDPELARALISLIKPAWTPSDSSKLPPIKIPGFPWLEGPVEHFTATNLIEAMLKNIDSEELLKSDIPMARLAHLTAVGEAELALRREAKNSKKAARLLSEFEALRSCERSLY